VIKNLFFAISPNSTTGVMCSGRGECICGFCSCNPLRPQSSQIYSGQFCECNDYSCSYSNNRMCAGNKFIYYNKESIENILYSCISISLTCRDCLKPTNACVVNVVKM
jgi:protocadherin alpha